MRRTNCVNVFSTDYHKTLNTLLLTPFYFLFLFFLCTNDFMYLCAKERKIKNISMILFFRTPSKSVMAVECDHALTQAESDKLCWLVGEATPESEENLKGHFVGPRREMITPWSTNAVEITQNMGLSGISRIEEYFPVKDENADRDPMLQRMYKGLDQEVFTTTRKPEPIVPI